MIFTGQQEFRKKRKTLLTNGFYMNDSSDYPGAHIIRLSIITHIQALVIYINIFQLKDAVLRPRQESSILIQKIRINRLSETSEFLLTFIPHLRKASPI